MWPLEPAARHHLRIGRHAVEHWVEKSRRLECVAMQPLPARSHAIAQAGRWPDLEAALVALFVDQPKPGVTLLLESALMPVLLVEAGRELWRPAQMQALLRHRLDALYAQPGSASEPWETRIDFIAGEPTALGFGIQASLKTALVAACAAAQVECRRMLPALAWGLDRLDLARRVSAQRCWLGWTEQDRLLLAQIDAGRVMSLNAAAAPTVDSAAIERQVASEQFRQGAPREGKVLATRWNAQQRPGLVKAASIADAVSWIDIGQPGLATASAGNPVTRQWATPS